MVYDVVVIGAGLAGCSSAIQLARMGHRVLLLEKRAYPAHKLCGEFLSVEVQALFHRLGALESVLAAGAQETTRALVTAPGGQTYEGSLPGTALGLSRYRLDSILCDKAQRAGVVVRTRAEARDVAGSLSRGFSVTTNEATYKSRVVVGAYGKRSTLDRKLDRPFMLQPSRFVAFKAHFEGVDIGPTIELHAFPGGYCGLSRVEGGLVNACWISTQRALKNAGGRPEGMIADCFTYNEHLRGRFDALRRVSESFSAISQISLLPKSTFESDICMVGDTAGMIAPLCGDGMAMALRSAELATPLISAYLNQEVGPDEFRGRYHRAWRGEFRSRMLLGRAAHYAFSAPGLSRAAVSAFNHFPALGQWVIRNTRGASETRTSSHFQVQPRPIGS